MNKYSVLLIALLVISCNNTSTYHLPQAEMTKMLADLQSAEVYSTMVKKDSTSRGYDKNMDSLAVYYKEIFAHYKVTQQQFDESLTWYKNHPDDLDTMYAKIITDIGKYDK